MAGIVAVIAKVMPESLDVDLEKIKEESKKVLESEGAMNISYEEKPIAFGLKALMVKMAWPEEKETDLIVQKIKSVSGVSEVDIVDYRRAFG